MWDLSSSQAVIMADGKMFAYGNMRTGSDSPDSARNALKFALGEHRHAREALSITV